MSTSRFLNKKEGIRQDKLFEMINIGAFQIENVLPKLLKEESKWNLFIEYQIISFF
jgi:hypothetical protein